MVSGVEDGGGIEPTAGSTGKADAGVVSSDGGVVLGVIPRPDSGNGSVDGGAGGTLDCVGSALTTAATGCLSTSLAVFFCCSSASFSDDGIDVSANKSCSLVMEADTSSAFSVSVPVHPECKYADL